MRHARGFVSLWSSHTLAAAVLAAAVGICPRALADDKLSAGERVYQQRCASCHGPGGQGVEDEHPDPLLGDKSAVQLAKYIERWMPEDEPEQVVGEDAEHVARYIYDAFYSPIAQARNRPPRIELSRLTVRQYRNAVADLIGGFRPPSEPGDERGLKAAYYNGERPRGKEALERTDPQVRFTFGASNPPPEQLDAVKGFTVRWAGALLAPETGDYKIVIRTNHAARLWLNDRENPLIDAWVKSGDQTEYRGSIFLVGGRAYPLRLDYTSRQQGVEDQKKYGDKPLEQFVELRWERPHHAAEAIPSRHLAPQRTPEVFIVETPFPPDDRSIGYERGSSISKAWDNATTDAAIETAGYIAAHLDELAGAREERVDREHKLRAFCRRLVERAFRRPLTDDQRRLYIDRQFTEAENLEAAVKRVVLLALKSPRFLYVDFGGQRPDGYDVAMRLALALWDSLPDDQLLDAAAAGKLGSTEEVRRQAERMIDDPRARSKVRQFLHHWLKLDHIADLAKDQEMYPGFDERLASDLRTSLDLLLDEVVWGEGSDFRRLLVSDELYVNGRLAQFYGIGLPADAPFQKIKASQPQRVGVLTHPYLMAGFAYTDTSSPIHRGVFLARSVLGRTLRPPPEAFTPFAPDLHPDLTTRQRVALQTEPKNCQTCHGLINSLGFTLEHFDAVGRYRQVEKGKPIDASGAYELPSGRTATFEGARDLAEFLAGSEQTHRSFVLQLFQNLVKQPVMAYGPQTPQELREAFASHNFSIRKLMVEIAARSALHGLEAKPPTPAVARRDESSGDSLRTD